jgi:hypothetical protein
VVQVIALILERTQLIIHPRFLVHKRSDQRQINPQQTGTMSVETKLPHSNQPMSLSKMLLVPSNGGTLTSTVSVTGSPSTVVIDNSPEVAGRDILFRAMLKDDAPVMIPQEYLTECLDADVNVLLQYREQ